MPQAIANGVGNACILLASQHFSRARHFTSGCQAEVETCRNVLADLVTNVPIHPIAVWRHTTPHTRETYTGKIFETSA